MAERESKQYNQTDVTIDEVRDAVGDLSATDDRSRGSSSASIVDFDTLLSALRQSIKPCGGPSNGGLDNHMWAAIVDRQGVVLAVCRSGQDAGDQWPGSRAIAVAKANTANALSLPSFAISTANLYAGASAHRLPAQRLSLSSV